MFASLRHLIGWVIHAFRSRQDLLLENLALRQQLLALHAKRPGHRLSTPQKWFWAILRRLWSGWKTPLVLVTPRRVVEWHRAGFRLYWKWLSRARQVGGRKPVSRELRVLIFRMVAENPSWGAPRIHVELLKLGFPISQPTEEKPMTDTVVEALILDPLQWLEKRERNYEEVMDAWRTSCPRSSTDQAFKRCVCCG